MLSCENFPLSSNKVSISFRIINALAKISKMRAFQTFRNSALVRDYLF